DLYFGEYNSETGYQYMLEAIEKENTPTAFLCASDTIAMGALSAIGRYQDTLKHPISIIGFNNITSAKYMNPPLTTIELDTKVMGEMAANLLLHLIRSKKIVPAKVSLTTTLIERKSVHKI